MVTGSQPLSLCQQAHADIVMMLVLAAVGSCSLFSISAVLLGSSGQQTLFLSIRSGMQYLSAYLPV